MKDSDSVLLGLLLSSDPWIYIEPNETKVSFEDSIRYGGKYIIHGSKEYVENLAKRLEKMIGKAISSIKYSKVPVVNGLSDFSHPCQGLADLFTIYEKKGHLSGLKLAYVGDGNNVAHSLIYGCSKVGMDIALACPKGYEPNPEVVSKAKEEAKRNGCRVRVTNDPKEAVKGADIVYTDVWASMGQEKEHEERIKVFKPYQVNSRLVKEAKGDYLFMHCLPAHRGEEVTDEVADSKNSVIFDQAENRLHTQKALLVLVM